MARRFGFGAPADGAPFQDWTASASGRDLHSEAPRLGALGLTDGCSQQLAHERGQLEHMLILKNSGGKQRWDPPRCGREFQKAGRRGHGAGKIANERSTARSSSQSFWPHICISRGHRADTMFLQSTCTWQSGAFERRDHPRDARLSFRRHWIVSKGLNLRCLLCPMGHVYSHLGLGHTSWCTQACVDGS